MSDDPTAIRSLAVHADDVLAALEANARRDAGAVLRVTPPFSGRMRARLHLEGRGREYDDPEPLHVPPDRLVAGLPPFPTPDDTEDALRARGEYTPERHRERHERAVDGWRRATRARLREVATIDTLAGEHRVSVSILG